jgi:hypothetical protein
MNKFCVVPHSAAGDDTAWCTPGMEQNSPKFALLLIDEDEFEAGIAPNN